MGENPLYTQVNKYSQGIFKSLKIYYLQSKLKREDVIYVGPPGNRGLVLNILLRSEVRSSIMVVLK